MRDYLSSFGLSQPARGEYLRSWGKSSEGVMNSHATPESIAGIYPTNMIFGKNLHLVANQKRKILIFQPI